MSETKKHNSNKRKNIFTLLRIFGIVILSNFVLSYYFVRMDLTTEKRYTLAPSTIKLLEKLDDVVYLKIYLNGDLNPSFTRLKNETKEILDQFRAHTDNLIEYEFINISESGNKEEISNIEKQLYDKGIVPEQVIDRKKQKTSESLIWPGALVSYRGKERAWQIFKGQLGVEREASINNSVNELEYGLTNTIRLLQSKRTTEVTFIEGHGELDTLQQYDFMRALGEYYTVTRTQLKYNSLRGSSAIVIAQPDSAFTEKEKFVIDQFVMNGGKVLWLLDPIEINMDTFRLKGFSIGLSNHHNLEDLLFKYGVRLNPVLVQDLNCSYIPVNVGFRAGQPNFQMFPWIYNPLVLSDVEHPIVRNLDLIKFQFVSSLDTISSAKGIKKTILLRTSRYSKLQPTPARISMAIVKFPAKEDQYRNPYQPIACLLEGSFESNYKNRLSNAMYARDSIFKIKDQSVPTKMIVVADGDVSRNDLVSGMPPVLGYDKYMRQTFSNKTFLLNCMNYLLDDEGLLQLRAREVKLRLLDKKKITNHETKWQLINVALPLGIVIVFGLVQFYLRKRRYAK